MIERSGLLVVLGTCAQDVANSGGVQLYGGHPVDSTPGATLLKDFGILCSGKMASLRFCPQFEVLIRLEGNALFHRFCEYLSCTVKFSFYDVYTTCLVAILL